MSIPHCHAVQLPHSATRACWVSKLNKLPLIAWDNIMSDPGNASPSKLALVALQTLSWRQAAAVNHAIDGASPNDDHYLYTGGVALPPLENAIASKVTDSLQSHVTCKQ